jgi:drug/metabolite transporter (DMT)-like permease
MQHLATLQRSCPQAFNPVTVYVVSILTVTEQPTLASTLKVLIVCVGVAIAGYGDISFSVIGVCLQLGSSVMDSIRCVTLQRVLQADHIQVGWCWLC